MNSFLLTPVRILAAEFCTHCNLFSVAVGIPARSALQFSIRANIIYTTPLKPTSPSSLSSPSSSSSSPSSTSAPQGLSTVSIVVTVLANILIGLLIGSICLYVILRIRRKIQGRTASPDRQSVPDSENSHKEVKDTSEAGTSPVYSTLQLPTSSCDSASTASTTRLPTNLSDSSMSAVEKSSEGLTYATVRFHTKSDDTARKVRFKVEEESCVYATVSHGNSHG